MKIGVLIILCVFAFVGVVILGLFLHLIIITPDILGRLAEIRNPTTTSTVTLPSVSTTTTIESTTTTASIRIINVYEINTINRTVNLTKIQLHRIRNLIPKECKTVGCSYGFDLCRGEVFNILDIPSERYSTKPKTNVQEYLNFEEETPCMPVLSDGWSDYLEFSPYFWYVSRNGSIGDNTTIKVRRR